MSKYDKYIPFIEDVKKIRGLARLTITYNPSFDSIELYFTQKQWNTIDNENSKTWERFSDLLSKYDYYHEFKLYSIEVFDEW